ncbi:MAG: penicillin-binding transpeptidase domain-containing protein [Pirellulales bacterium]
MPRPDRYFDWQSLQGATRVEPPSADSRRRMRLLLGCFVLAVATIGTRGLVLNLTQGAAYRRAAARPAIVEVRISAPRGRILARDGTVLAKQRRATELRVHYRYLEEPADETWLRRTARARLPAGDRRDTARLHHEMDRLRVERDALHRRLAALGGVTSSQWERRRAAVQSRVERIAASVNARQHAEASAVVSEDDQRVASGYWSRLVHLAREALADPPAPVAAPPIVIAEQLDHHVMFEDLSASAVQTIEQHAEKFPGVVLHRAARREYPHGSLAAHVLGYLGAIDPETLAGDQDNRYAPDDVAGRRGIEMRYEPLLRGEPGREVRMLDASETVVSASPARPGRDVTLSLDVDLQRSAESLLDSALELKHHERPASPNSVAPLAHGGAVVVLDCHSGDVLAAASSPRFDPNVFASGESSDVARLLGSPKQPLYDRVTQMALAPGSIAKPVVAAALLEEGVVHAEDSFYCQGYLHSPEAYRCLLFRHYGVGHDEVTMPGALAQSCNVYFFHHAERLGATRLTDWLMRFGLGGATGVDLPYEAAGHLPNLDGSKGNAEVLGLAVGQGALTATPLQIARAVAVVANGGRLITPRLVRAASRTDTGLQRTGRRVPQLREDTTATVRAGMRQAVVDPRGTAHRHLLIPGLPVAAKTGTAETQSAKGDHAWIAGYAPADAPQIVFVVALAHGGSGATAAGPIARRLLINMQRLGYFYESELAEGTDHGSATQPASYETRVGAPE